MTELHSSKVRVDTSATHLQLDDAAPDKSLTTATVHAQILSPLQRIHLQSSVTFLATSTGPHLTLPLHSQSERAFIVRRYFDLEQLPESVGRDLASSSAWADCSLTSMQLTEVWIEKRTFRLGGHDYALKARFALPGLHDGQYGLITVPLKKGEYRSLKPSALQGKLHLESSLRVATACINGEEVSLKVKVEQITGAGVGDTFRRIPLSKLKKVLGFSLVEVFTDAGNHTELYNLFSSNKTAPSFLRHARVLHKIPPKIQFGLSNLASFAAVDGVALSSGALTAPLKAHLRNRVKRREPARGEAYLTSEQRAYLEGEIKALVSQHPHARHKQLRVRKVEEIEQHYFSPNKIPHRLKQLLDRSPEAALFGDWRLLGISCLRVRKKTNAESGETSVLFEFKFRPVGLLEGQRVEVPISLPRGLRDFETLSRKATRGMVLKRREHLQDSVRMPHNGETRIVSVERDTLLRAGRRGEVTHVPHELFPGIIDIEASPENYPALREAVLTNGLTKLGRVYLPEYLPGDLGSLLSMKGLANNGFQSFDEEVLGTMHHHLRRHRRSQAA